jgi:hypothetical protein
MVSEGVAPFMLVYVNIQGEIRDLWKKGARE